MEGRSRVPPERLRHKVFRYLAAIALAAMYAPAATAAGGVLEDAPLNDVAFVDPARGWAVGDRGVIWRTEDGGRRWLPQESSVKCRLHDIFFLDGQQGWIVGGWTHPYTHKSTGVVLRTSDGGRSWERLPTAGVPMLRRIEMTDTRRGWAASAPSPLYPAGICRTEDGGRGWAPIAGPPNRAGEAGDSEHLPSPPHAESFQLRAKAVLGQKVWLVGNPGTRVFHSPDGGATWEAFPTDQTLPLRSLFFLDEHRGWAVGVLGTILATRDGGRTWLRQRSGGSRVAVLGVFAEPGATPWELFVRLSGNEGYLGAAEYLCDPLRNASPLAEIDLADRLHEAMLAAGGCYAGTSRDYPARASQEAFEEYVVRKIRQWRPDVIVTEAPSAGGGTSLPHRLNQTVLNAVIRAQDAASFPEHARQMGLAPWSVTRVFGVQPSGVTGSIALTTASLAPQAGGTLADGGAGARALVECEFRRTPAKIEFQRMIDRGAASGAAGDFLAGLTLPAGGEARRRAEQLSAGSLDLVARNAQKHRNVQNILAQRVEQSAGGVTGQIEELTRGFDNQAVGELLFQLAEQLRQQGQAEQAAEVYQQLLQRNARHDLAEAASLRLLHFYASSEAAWRLASRTEIRQGAATGVEPATFLAPEDGIEAEGGPDAVRAPLQVRGAATTAATSTAGDRDRQALDLGEALARMRPSLFAEPLVRFPLAAAARRQRDPGEGDRYFRQLLVQRGPEDVWRRRAEAELWLMQPAGDPPKAFQTCQSTEKKPYLDGDLEDAVWRNAQPIELPSAEGSPATVYLARDDDYLYFAARCPKSARAAYPAAEGARSYDAPLENTDRLELRIDLDRDYATWHRFAVDHRGWTADASCGDSSWNPQWFVARIADGESWTIEAAIPFRELSGQAPRRRDVWAVGVRRITPVAGSPSLPALADAEAFADTSGLLLFE